jgi:hypothetical protein
MPTPKSEAQTRAAINERVRRQAVRATEDPARLAYAAKIVRAALERNKLTLADIQPDGGGR